MDQPSTRKQIHIPSSPDNEQQQVKHSFEPQTRHQIVLSFLRGGGRLKIVQNHSHYPERSRATSTLRMTTKIDWESVLKLDRRRSTQMGFDGNASRMGDHTTTNMWLHLQEIGFSIEGEKGGESRRNSSTGTTLNEKHLSTLTSNKKIKCE